MAKKYLLILSVFIQACSSQPKMDSRFDPSHGLSSNEGTLSGVYAHPVAIARPIGFPDSQKAQLLFQGSEPTHKIQVQVTTEGTFQFKAPAGKYRLAQILIGSKLKIFEGPRDGFEFEISASKNTVAGTFYSSCDDWNANKSVERRFQDLISKREYESFKRYDAETFSCLVFHTSN